MTLTEGYLRSTRFKLSRAFHTARGGADDGDVPTYLAIHEYDREELDFAAMLKRNDTPWQREITKKFPVSHVTLNRVVGRFGEGRFFDEREGYLNVAPGALKKPGDGA